MDRVIAAWKSAGLLVPNNNLKFAMPMFLVPKPNNEVRPRIDYSSWTDYIVTPRFSLKTAGEALRLIPANSLMIKIDLKSGFHQLPLHSEFFNHNGVLPGREAELNQAAYGTRAGTFSFPEICHRVP